ncbi:endonuclease VII [Arthrobacter phage MargaretKali]|uniref:Endonuclease n=1 Tax=Arthrobacter phage MargaretKali TaxID=2250414 RepID=A0A345KMY4_9CAUD|nr:endonuclease VII [Arthrobacter phage MargaretKali]AXH44386.1 endonuclease [Arthrobacter phage MargaretKali]
MKTCSKCGVAKPLSDFYKHKSNADGRFGSCKACVLEERRLRYEADRDALKARVRQYAVENPDRVVESRNKSRTAQKADGRYAATNRKNHLLRTYGLTVEAYDEMFSAQGEACAVCRSSEPGKCWAVDHDHATGEVRGILCWNCNVGLGHFRDDPIALIAAADYVMRSRAAREAVG